MLEIASTATAPPERGDPRVNNAAGAIPVGQHDRANTDALVVGERRLGNHQGKAFGAAGTIRSERNERGSFSFDLSYLIVLLLLYADLGRVAAIS